MFDDASLACPRLLMLCLKETGGHGVVLNVDAGIPLDSSQDADGTAEHVDDSHHRSRFNLSSIYN